MENFQPAIIFDLDGLMLDTERISLNAWKKAALDFDYNLTEEVFVQAIGRKISDTEALFKSLFGNDFPFHEVRAKRLEYGEMHLKEFGMPKKPGLLELLVLLENNKLKKAIATSTHKKFAEEKLSLAGLENRFSVIITGDQVHLGKPEPEIFLKAASALSVPPQECFVLEDSEPGIEAAFRAGMIPIMVPDLQTPSLETKNRAYKIFNSLFEVSSFFVELGICK